jgi:hypothetical protein
MGFSRADSASWARCKQSGDEAERAVADWWRGKGFTVHRAVGEAGHDLRVYADIEVKHDLAATRTGNIAVEIAYGGAPSGVVTTGASWWFIVVGREGFIVRAKRLRQLAMTGKWAEKSAGDGGKARVKLVPVAEVRAIARVIDLCGPAEG